MHAHGPPIPYARVCRDGVPRAGRRGPLGRHESAYYEFHWAMRKHPLDKIACVLLDDVAVGAAGAAALANASKSAAASAASASAPISPISPHHPLRRLMGARACIDCSTRALAERQLPRLARLVMGWSLRALRQDGGFDAADLRDAGYTAAELLHGDHPTAAADGRPPSGQSGAFAPAELRPAGYAASELKEAGLDARAIRAAGYSLAELKEAGFGAEELRTAALGVDLRTLHQVRAIQMRARTHMGSSRPRAPAADHSDGHPSRYLAPCTLCTRKRAALPHAQVGFSIRELRTDQLGFTLSELVEAGFTACELRQAGFDPFELRTFGFSAYEMRLAGFELFELSRVGYSARELHDAGFELGALAVDEEVRWVRVG